MGATLIANEAMDHLRADVNAEHADNQDADAVSQNSQRNYERVEEIDRTYRDTAVTLGLMKPEEVEQEDLDTAMKNWVLNNPGE